MIPSNPSLHDVTSANRKFLVAAFQFPDGLASNSELVDYELGGVALQDPSLGLQYQTWKAHWNSADSTVYATPSTTGVPVALHTRSDVIELAFTFDQNMRWSTAVRLAGDIMEHRWYDSAIESYRVSTYTGVTSVRITLDDKRDIQIHSGVSDVILTYIKSGLVKWRIQRDRFLTEYGHSTAFSENVRITQFGMNIKNRLQWRLGPRRINL